MPAPAGRRRRALVDSVTSFCNAWQMRSPEVYICCSPNVFSDDGEISDDTTVAFLSSYMKEFGDHVERVLTVLPRQ